jgi:UDP-N-acetylglucosamine 2-epimerase (non-hydrolysing)
MIDSLVRLLPQAHCSLPDLPERYALVTMHRPANVDDPVFLGDLLATLEQVGRVLPVIFPVHPRTRQRIAEHKLTGCLNEGVRLTEPLSYLEFLSLQSKATVVITDSGGIQEETTFLRVPCLTVRENTERPITTTLGSNVLVGRNMQRLREEVDKILAGEFSPGQVPPLWDGRTGQRIAHELVNSKPAEKKRVTHC